MPQFRGITVHVTDGEGQELPERGVQLLLRHNKISAYIESRSNQVFQIIVQAHIPYPHDPQADNNQGGYGQNREHHLPYAGSGELSGKQTGSPDNTDSGSNSASDDENSPPFDFCVYLFLDGRTKAERKKFIVLDPDDEFFKHGELIIDSRSVQATDGTIHKHTFMFSEIGIDTMFDKLALSTRLGQVGDEDAITAAMDDVNLRSDTDPKKEEQKCAGQIRVVIKRVLIADQVEESASLHSGLHKEGENEDADMSAIGSSSLTHTTALTKTQTQLPMQRATKKYWPYDDEIPFATFVFFYRSHETLEKMFSNVPPRIPVEAQLQSISRQWVNTQEASSSTDKADDPANPAQDSTAQETPSSSKHAGEDDQDLEEDADIPGLGRCVRALTLKRQRGSDDEGSAEEGESEDEGGAGAGQETGGSTETGEEDVEKDKGKSEPPSKRVKK